MGYLNIIREINRHSKDHYEKPHKQEHLEFLGKCNSTLFTFFKEKLKNDFLFSALTYKKNSTQIFEVVPGTDIDTDYNFSPTISDKINAAVKELVNEAKDEIIINVTNLLIDEKHGKDLFFIQDNNNYTDIINGTSILGFDLSKLSFEKEYEDFSKNKKNSEVINEFAHLLNLNKKFKYDKYARYLWHYKKIEKNYISENPQSNFFIHFIRPSFIELDYNLLLSLATNRLLLSEELAVINLLIYRIVAQTAIEKVAEAERDKYYQDINVSVHFIKTAIDVQLNPSLQNLLIDKNTRNNKDVLRLEEGIKKLKNIAEVINLITKLHDSNVNKMSEDILLKSKLFTNKNPILNFHLLLSKTIENANNNSNGISIIWNNEETQHLELDIDFLKFKNLYPTPLLFDLFLNTVVENIHIYCDLDESHNRKVKFTYNKKNKMLTVENRPKDKLPLPKTTGNIASLTFILKKLGIGTIAINKDNGLYSISLISY